MNALVDAAAIAELLGVPVGWVREQTRADNLPHVKLGRYRRYDRDEVLAWIESLKSGGGPAYRRHQPRPVTPTASRSVT